LANIVKRHPAKLIYDSHEFELYRYAPGRTGIQRKLIKFVEGFLIRRVDLALMVGDKIADGVQEIYHLETRPTVVRNIPPYWHLKPEKSAIIRRRFLEAMKLSPQGFLLMYHGGISRGRGIESVIRALPFLPDDIGLVIMGNENSPEVIKTFWALAEENGVGNRVFFHPAVPAVELKDYISAMDGELILIEGKYCVSYKYSLPNKFFESVQACVPIICTDLPEMGKIVRGCGIGLLVNEDDEKSVAEAAMKLRKDKTLYDRLKRNMEKAKMELCWEKESLKLKAAIQGMIGEGEWPCKG
jgi:glycosyltransferase involved in cell wall biosynthesis